MKNRKKKEKNKKDIEIEKEIEKEGKIWQYKVDTLPQFPYKLNERKVSAEY